MSGRLIFIGAHKAGYWGHFLRWVNFGKEVAISEDHRMMKMKIECILIAHENVFESQEKEKVNQDHKDVS